MNKKLVFVMAVVVLGTSMSSVWAIDWTGAGADDLWSNTDNWSLARVPDSSDTVSIMTGNSLIDATVAGVADSVYLGSDVEVPTLTITGGSLTVGDRIWAPWGNTYTARIIMSGGTLRANGSFAYFIGQRGVGYLDMTGGDAIVNRFDVGDAGTGIVSLDGGTITCNSFNMNGISSMDITGGVLFIQHTWSGYPGYIQNLVNNHQITAYGYGPGDPGWGTTYNILAEFDGAKTTVTAIPEPATMALLSLGALALLRKRK